MLLEEYNLNITYEEVQKKIIETIKTLNKERFVNETGVCGKKQRKYYKLFYRFRKVDAGEVGPRSVQEDFTINQMYVRLSLMELNSKSSKLQFKLIDKTNVTKKQAIFLGAPTLIMLIWFLAFTAFMSLESYNVQFKIRLTIIVSTLLSIGICVIIRNFVKSLNGVDKEDLFRQTVDTFMNVLHEYF